MAEDKLLIQNQGEEKINEGQENHKIKEYSLDLGFRAQNLGENKNEKLMNCKELSKGCKKVI